MPKVNQIRSNPIDSHGIRLSHRQFTLYAKRPFVRRRLDAMDRHNYL